MAARTSRDELAERLTRIWCARIGVAVVGLALCVSPAVADETQPSFLGLPAPPGFIPPPLHPEGATLRPVMLSENVYALRSDKRAVDNSGFVVGSRGVLVIDSHINAAMANQILSAVAKTTGKPVLYLVNTNYHGDHSFGNYAFPDSTVIVGHVDTAKMMMDVGIDLEKEFILPTVDGDSEVCAEVEWRKPTLLFDRFLSIDLGGQLVEVHHFGAGSTVGDTVVYVPSAKVAWTGNLVVGAGTIPPMFDGHPKRYLATVKKLRETLDVDTIVPGHGRLAKREHLDRYVDYMESLVPDLDQAAADGLPVDVVLERLPLDRYLRFPEGTPASFVAYVNSLHRLNVMRSHLQHTRSPN